MSKKICVICGKEFMTKRGNVICCSDECNDIRKREAGRKYREEHKEQIKEYQREWSKQHYETKPVKEVEAKLEERKVKTLEQEPEWIVNYRKGDRLTQISMLAIALTDYQIKLITYGQLSQLWLTEQYDQWEKQVFARKRKEHEYAKAKDSTKSKNKPKGKNRFKG